MLLQQQQMQKRLMCEVSSMAQGVMCLDGLRGGLNID